MCLFKPASELIPLIGGRAFFVNQFEFRANVRKDSAGM
ncbi:hypothetical protein C1A50_2875 [Paenibacillus polymyxa]|nr:hypothetical protein C1A50_2875 [Paenibacillus polymyxa]